MGRMAHTLWLGRVLTGAARRGGAQRRFAARAGVR